jgi:putative DNA primase/helicase
MIAETTGAITLTASLENIPEELTERDQWVCWRYEERDGKMTKVPKTYRGTAASSTDESTWTTFEYAVAAVGQTSGAGADGVGFVFSDDDPYAGIDLDECRDPETGNVEEWAREILKRVGPDAYIEISPSGTGIHIIVEGAVRDGGMRKGNLEMYSRGRFFTVTGARFL